MDIEDSSLDYHQDSKAELFENWFRNYWFLNIPKNSVIVIDNACKAKNRANTKKEFKNICSAF